VTVFARNLGTNDIEDMYEAFHNMDTNGDGTLSMEELRIGMSTIAHKSLPAEDVQALFQAVDIDGSGAIDYSEFLAAALDHSLFFREDLCLQVFRSLDRDSSGFISVQELQELLDSGEAHDFLGSHLHDEAHRMIQRYDADGDGRLDFVEFTKLVTQTPERYPAQIRRRSAFINNRRRSSNQIVEIDHTVSWPMMSLNRNRN